MQKLSATDSRSLKFLLLNAIASAAYYSPSLFLRECTATGCTIDLFNIWLSHCLEMRTNFQRRVAVLGLGAFCRVPLAQQPPELAPVFDKVLGVMMGLLEQKEVSEAGDDDEDADDDEGLDDDDDEDEDDEDEDPQNRFAEADEDANAVDGDDVEYMKMLTQKMKDGFGGGCGESDVSDSDFESPLDGINHYVHWAAAVQRFAELNASAFAAWTASLAPEQAAELQRWSAKANEERARMAEEEAKEGAGRP